MLPLPPRRPLTWIHTRSVILRDMVNMVLWYMAFPKIMDLFKKLGGVGFFRSSPLWRRFDLVKASFSIIPAQFVLRSPFHDTSLNLLAETYEGLGLGANGDPKGGLALGGFSNPVSGRYILCLVALASHIDLMLHSQSKNSNEVPCRDRILQTSSGS